MRIRICLTGEVETLSSPIRRQAPDAKYLDGMTTEKIPDVRHPGGMSAEKIPDVIHPGGMAARSPYPDSLREKHTALTIITPRTIAYPIRICCPDEKKRKEPTFRRSPMVCPDTLSGHLLSWISKNSPQSWIALVIKLLTKNTKTYTI